MTVQGSLDRFSNRAVAALRLAQALELAGARRVVIDGAVVTFEVEGIKAIAAVELRHGE